MTVSATAAQIRMVPIRSNTPPRSAITDKDHRHLEHGLELPHQLAAITMPASEATRRNPLMITLWQ